MKKLFIIVFSVLAVPILAQNPSSQKISLAGEWKFRIDSLDRGVTEKWYNTLADETVKLPGSMAENGKGDEVRLKTKWTGDIIDKSYFTSPKYEKYRQPGNIKIPFWLKPVKYYKGAAWYQREIYIPEGWTGKRIFLSLERCHWESSLFVNGTKAGSQNSLNTPHVYDISTLVRPGKNLISIRVDNRIIIPVGVNSHSISDHTQGDWNGIAGDISLSARPVVYIDEVRIFPDIETGIVKAVVSIKNFSGSAFGGRIAARAGFTEVGKEKRLREKIYACSVPGTDGTVTIEYKIDNPRLWSEFSPNVYILHVSLSGKDKSATDVVNMDFGMRKFSTRDTQFEINGSPIFLRGTTECCVFPLTGYPPSDVASWERILKTCKDYGLNHVRFHSYCPPEAAFIAADRLGIYFHIECGSWANQGSSIGSGTTLDQYIYDESERIIREYGNHPSFCMLAYGNEPAGRNQNAFLGKLINHWKAEDNRRVYTSAAGWPIIPENDYNLTSEPRIQHWGEGLKSIINAQTPQTMFDFHDFTSKYNVPTVGHEIGQWCVYPDFSEIAKYTGILKPSNFEIFRETLTENKMGDQAHDFLMASGKLQALCYKADIEAALRTPGFGGFEMLQLHDFPGQGTALVGILNPFFESKGYITPDEFRMFCNETVPLALMSKLVYKTGEVFQPMVELAHYGAKTMKNIDIDCRVTDEAGRALRQETMKMAEVKPGSVVKVGVFGMDTKGIERAEKLTFLVSIVGTNYKNSWDIWVYPDSRPAERGKVYITETLDEKASAELKKGGSVLLLTYGKVGKTKGAQVAIGFSSIFWNTAWTGNQPPHTLGILCDPKHSLFTGFPTEYHSNWQWWDPVTHSQAMILDGFPDKLRPLIQPIDTWFENRRLALAFESKTGGGKLFVCSINMKDSLDQRPVSLQLYNSIIKYMNGDSFDPKTEVEISRIEEMCDL
jgi:hypothetical protein